MTITYTTLNVVLGSTLLGLSGGVVGSFALLRRQSLLGDALAHAALPGICVAYIFTWEKSPLVLLPGAMVAGVLGALFIQLVIRWSRVKEDAAIGIVLSVFFGVGIVLLTKIQQLPAGNQSGLKTFLFGQAATLLEEDVILLAVVAAVVLGLVMLFFKELKLLAFDQDYGRSLGYPMKLLDVLLTGLLVLVVVAGLQTVGVILMVAALITPAAAARQWTNRLGLMVILAGIVGSGAGVTGALLSSTTPRLPPGPTIVLISSAVLVASLLLAPRRGILWSWFRERSSRRRVHDENFLKDLYSIGERIGGWAGFVPITALMGLRGKGAWNVEKDAARLAREGLVARSQDAFKLTDAGLEAAQRVVRRHRLWEVYLTVRLALASDHVHRDADAMEHALSDVEVDELEARLGFPSIDPHGKPIPSRRPS